MNKKQTIIGYSGFVLFEECYEYNENACFIAESKDKATQFMKDCGYDKSDFRIDEISLNDLQTDYGCSCGEFAMEEIAFKKFEKIAKEKKQEFKVENYDFDPTLKVVQINDYESND
ncbi:MAG: hypothetical protein GY756_23300 [bacterium]|nr:hypothetical protein [bacterium]